jgi:hypothetical protein
MLVELALVLAGVAVLAAVVFLALGRGGELGKAHPDHPPMLSPGHRPVMGTDAALIRLPKVFWGYHVDLTDEALRRLAYALTERDTRVARLEQQLADARQALEEREHRAEPDGAWFAAPTPGPAPQDTTPAPDWTWASPADPPVFGPQEIFGPHPYDPHPYDPHPYDPHRYDPHRYDPYQGEGESR